MSAKGTLNNLQGHSAEAQAARHYIANGCTILENRFKTPNGEVDLIARDGNTLIFIEVKARASIEAAMQSVTPTQWQRIIAVAQSYIEAHTPTADMRFDLFAADQSGQFTILENVTQGF